MGNNNENDSNLNHKISKKNFDELLCEIESRVRVVRTARIEAAERNKQDDYFYNRISIIYTVIVTVLSVRFGIAEYSGENNDSNFGVSLLAISVYLTLFTMYISNKNYAEKVSKFQSNYMELTRLHSDIQRILAMNLSDDEKANHYNDFADRYASLLAQSDNHEDVDYYKAILRKEKDIDEIKKGEMRKKINQYKWKNTMKKSIVVLSLPIIFGLMTLIDILIR